MLPDYFAIKKENMDYILQVTFSLIGVLGLIVLAFWGIRKLNKGVITHSGNRMKILDRINLGQDKMMVVVSICGKCMVVGVTSHRIEKICDLDCSEDDYTAEMFGQNGENSQNSGFFGALTQTLADRARGRMGGKGFADSKKNHNENDEDNEKNDEGNDDKVSY